MLPAYILTVDVTSNDINISEDAFFQQVNPSLLHLNGLKGSFDRSPCRITYYPPDEQNDTSLWSARGYVSLSLGKQRAVFLQELYQSIVQLIMLELPHLKVEGEISKFEFS
jgi:hypothetical protein